VSFPASVAQVGDWILRAWDTGWDVRHRIINPNQAVAFSPFPYDSGDAQARRDAETALRLLGVVFRTDGAG
jgi:hypothetical protein